MPPRHSDLALRRGLHKVIPHSMSAPFRINSAVAHRPPKPATGRVALRTTASEAERRLEAVHA
jgi:hypothetical protein